MTTAFENCLRVDTLTLHKSTYKAFVLVFAVSTLLRPGALAAGAQAGSTPTDESRVKVETYEVLLDRVRTEPLLDLKDPLFPQFLITGGRHGGVLIFDTDLHDAMNPKTLETYFADWNLAARASLLLSYSRLVTDSDKPRPYVGIPDEVRRSIIAYEAEDRTRIRQIVHSGGYMDSWRPFAIAYRKLVQSARATLPPGDSPDGDTKTLSIVARLAREQGMFRLVRELPFDAADVTNEILRLLQRMRSVLGAPNGVSDRGPNLLYACGSDPIAVRVHTWHSLAPAFFRAAEAADGTSADPQALLIMALFDGLSKDINAWVATHPAATTLARDSELNQMAKRRGLFSLLEDKERP